MHLIRALSVIFGCLAIGEAVVFFTGIKLPGSIIGMGILFAALHLGWVKAAWLTGLVDTMMANLSLFLVPPCVAVMSYLDLVAKDFWSIAVATVLSTFAVMVVTGKTHEWLRKR
ncbi:MAG: CidA/LrgA family protein [Neisseria sp.]|nr:CidA/LrgA family protein [Neisseria sp.]